MIALSEDAGSKINFKKAMIMAINIVYMPASISENNYNSLGCILNSNWDDSIEIGSRIGTSSQWTLINYNIKRTES